MGISNPRDDLAERNRGVTQLSIVIPRVGNANLQQNPISDSYNIILGKLMSCLFCSLCSIKSTRVSERQQYC